MKIRESVKASALSNANIHYVSCNFFEKMKRTLSVWLEDGAGTFHGTIQGNV
jgi:hypothetical protein